MLTSPKVLNYPIPGNPTGGILHIYGEPAATQDVILYCGGFPDALEPISNLAERLATPRDGQEQGCYVGVTCFPGFDNKSFNAQKFAGFKKGGFTFDEVTCCVRDAAELLFREHAMSFSSSADECKTTFTLMTHDWGAVVGHIFINRAIEEDTFTQHKPNRLVFLDVLLFPHPKSNYREVLRGREIYKPTKRDHMFTLCYRVAFATSFAALKYISETVGLIVMAILSTIVFNILNLNPLQNFDGEHTKECIKDPKHFLYMMYPYYHMFREIFKGSDSVFDAATLPLNLKETPVLYIYGAKKNVMFHDYRSVELLEREEREGLSETRVVRLEDSGHWMYCQDQEPDVCENEIRKFLKEDNREASSDETQSRL